MRLAARGERSDILILRDKDPEHYHGTWTMTMSNEEGPRYVVALALRVVAGGLNFLLLAHSLLSIAVHAILGWQRLVFLIWVSGEAALALANMTALVLPWRGRMFSRTRIGVFGINVLAGIAYLYHLANVRTGLLPIEMAIESVVFFAILGVTITTFAMGTPMEKRRPFVCQKCGYDLRGTPSARCPECGWRRETAS